VAKERGAAGAKRRAGAQAEPRTRKPRLPPHNRPGALDHNGPGTVKADSPATERTALTRPLRPAFPHAPAPARAVEPPAPGLRRYFGEIWRQRAAFGYFALRFVQKRTGRTFFGWLWIFLPVLLPLFMGSLVFGGILGVSVPGVPYFLYYIVAMSAWTTFAMTAFWSTRSLEVMRSEVRRLYIPRLIPLISGTTLPVITLGIYLVLVALATLFYVLTRGEFYLALGPTTLLLPLGILMVLVMALACGLWFSPLAPRARDVRRLAGYVLGVWYFVTPVMYPIGEIPSGWQFLASLNPITAPIEMVKQGLLDVGDITTLGLAAYGVGLLVITTIGLRIFLSKERRDCVNY
jgi:lipopolysaccharide transport system permease protein